MAEDVTLRTTFNKIAQLYDKIRPVYPRPLFDDLIKETNLKADTKLLEIGPGTAQATLPLAIRGYDITGVELGKELAEIAKLKLHAYPKVKITRSAFEDAKLPFRTFDLVYAATAFHWIKPELRYKKTHNLLKPSGHLAIIRTNHVSDEVGDTFFNATQPIYDKYYPKSGDSQPPHSADVMPTELDANLFKLEYFKIYPLTVEYSGEEYAELLNTYSPTLALSARKRSQFLSDIKKLIDTGFNGSVVKHYAMSLTIAKKI